MKNVDLYYVFLAHAWNVLYLGFDFKNCFTVFYNLFLRHSNLNIKPNHSPKNFKKRRPSLDFFSTYFKRLDKGFHIMVSIWSTLLLFYSLRFFKILFRIIKPNHSPQKFVKRRLSFGFFSTYFKRTKLGFLFEELFLFYSLCFFEILFWIIKPNHSLQLFRKMSTSLGFFSTYFKLPKLGFPNQGSILSTLLLFFALRFFEILL